MKPELIADYACECGENPLWHEDEQRLYWVDITPGRLFRYDPASGKHEQCYEDGPVGGFTIQADGSLLLFMAEGAVKVWREGELSTVVDHLPEERGSRFNDVIADPAGRVFCGTTGAGAKPGRLYRLDLDGRLTKVLDGVEGANGLGFTPDRKHMYFTHTLPLEIHLYDYDQASGRVTNQRLFVRVPQGDGKPDGMTVDAEGFVWSAYWDGWCLVRFTPDGREERRITFPAKKVSSLIFGGRDYTDIYVTTAGGGDKAKEGSGAGALFRVNVGIRGLPEFRSRIGC